MGKASIPAKVLKMTLLPSAMGRAASGVAAGSRPKMSDPSVRKATVLPRQVRSKLESGSSSMARQAWRLRGFR